MNNVRPDCDVDAQSTRTTPLIIAVGASAGGLDAFGELLTSLGDEKRFAIVFAQHIQPDSKSLLVDLLREVSAMPLREIDRSTEVKAGQVYVAPPRTLVSLTGHTIASRELSEGDRPGAVIDHLFHSVAEAIGRRGVGVVLSGAGSDGTLGLKAISDAGGLTFAQEPTSAKFDSMPRNAATTGVADHVLTPKQIAVELKRYASFRETLRPKAIDATSMAEQIERVVPMVAETLLKETNHNFQHYKTSTMGRRISRRMQVLQIPRVDDYVERVQTDANESQALFRELLIGVTAFFRDPDSFAALAETVIPRLFAKRSSSDPVRIWVPGCATGQEAYTLAMLCREHIDTLGSGGRQDVRHPGKPKRSANSAGEQAEPSVQIFATDIDERALAIARQGTYPIGIAEQIAPQRLQRFFIKRGKQYTVTKELRELVLFSPHNLISDPPFSRQDLISCRNLLIYLGPHLQKKLIPLFHYAMRPGGYLFLGPSESISTHGDLFRNVEAKHRISQRKATAIARTAPLTVATNSISRVFEVSAAADNKTDAVQIMQRILLDEFSPKCCVVDEDGKIICSSAEMQEYITASEGAFENNVVKMARRGLRIGLRATLAEARRKRRRVTHENLSVPTDDGKQRVMLTVQPMPRLGEDEGLFMVVFHDVGLPMRSESRQDFRPDDPDALDPKLSASFATEQSTLSQVDTMIDQMQRELEATRADLERSMQDMESANEELKSSNEELLSMNEELQSANEELETSKEEIRAGSEALGRANSDLHNLLSSSKIATIFLDDELCIRSFTPAIKEIYGLIDTDVGRPLDMFKPQVEHMPALPAPGVFDDAAKDHDSPHDRSWEHIVRTRSGKCFVRRVLPYLDQDGRRDGIVVTFSDTTELVRTRQQLQTMADCIPPLIAVVDRNERYQFVNQAYAEHWRHTPNQIIGSKIADIVSAEVYRSIRPKLSQALSGERVRYDLEMTHPTTGETIHERVDYVPQFDADGQVDTVHVVITDMTFQKDAELELSRREKFSRTVLQASPDSVKVLDADGRLLMMNEAGMSQLEIDDFEPLRNQLWSSLWPDDTRDVVNDAMRVAEQNGEGRFQAYRPTAKGKPKHWDVIVRPIRNDDGTVERYVSVARDITDQHRREVNLREVAELEGIANSKLSETRLISMFLDRIRRQLGLSRLAFVELDLAGDSADVNHDSPAKGQSSVVGTMAISDFHPPDQVDEFRQGRQQVIRDVETDIADEHHRDNFRALDVRSLCNSCYVAGDDLTFVLSAHQSRPHDWNDGEREFLQDVTNRLCLRIERTRREAKLIDREAELRRVIDNMLNFVGVLDVNGTLVEINQTAVTAAGITREDVIGKPFWECYWWSHDEQVVAQLREAITRAKNGEVVRYDVLVRMADERLMVIDFMLAAIRDKSGNLTHLIPSGVDVSDRKAAELAVQKQQQTIELAMRAGKMGGWTWDVRSDQVHWTRSLGDLLGYTEQTMPTSVRQISELMPDDDRLLMQRHVEEALSGTGQRYRVEHRMRRGDGDRECAWIRAEAQIVRDEAGQAIQLIGIAIDVTEDKEVRNQQHQIKTELDEQRQRMALAMDAAKMGYFEWEPETDQTDWDQQWLSAVGLPKDAEKVGKTLFDMVHPDDIDELKRKAAVDKERPNYNHEFRIVRPDGEVRWLAGSGRFLTAKNGRPARMVGINWDITDAKRQAEELRLNSQRLAMAADAAGLGTLYVNFGENMVVFSDDLKRIVGIPPGHSIDLKPGQIPPFVHPDDRQRFWNHLQKDQLNRQKNSVASIDHRILRPDGEVRWVRLQTKTVFDGDGDDAQPVEMIGTLLDITKQQEYELKLEAAKQAAVAANESKSEFLANMSHEIRTPMTAILGYAELLEGEVTTDVGRGHLRTIRRNGDFLLEIINDILDLSKIEAGKLDIDREKFDPARVVEDVRSIMNVRATEKHLELDVEYRGKLPATIESDPKRLRQVLINLVGNAIKFTRDGEVKMIVRMDGDDLRFDICDSGIGISRQQQNRLFKPFMQGDSSVTREFGGTGLGLAISQRLSELLGGEISVKSDLGLGSTFTVRIDPGSLKDVVMVQPRLLTQEAAESFAESSAASPATTIPAIDANVLITDDRRDIRFLTKHILTKAGATVAEAEDGQLCVDHVKSAMESGDEPDLVILDMQMPNLDGYETARVLRHMGYEGPIIALTADAMHGDMRRCLQCGCNDYLSKPIDAGRLVQIVSELLTDRQED